MKKILGLAALTLSLSVGASAAPGKFWKRTKHTPAHKAAVRKCQEEYRAAVKQAHTEKGQARRDAEAAARTARKQCLAAAPM